MKTAAKTGVVFHEASPVRFFFRLSLSATRIVRPRRTRIYTRLVSGCASGADLNYASFLTALTCLLRQVPSIRRTRSIPPGTFFGAGHVVTVATAMAAISFADKGRRRGRGGDCEKLIDGCPFLGGKALARLATTLVLDRWGWPWGSRSRARAQLVVMQPLRAAEWPLAARLCFVT
jgi:hypothetical protein